MPPSPEQARHLYLLLYDVREDFDAVERQLTQAPPPKPTEATEQDTERLSLLDRIRLWLL